MRALPGFEGFMGLGEDIHLTPSWAVKAILDHFRPRGTILDPCEGEGAFADRIPGCLRCEIRKGTNFYDWTQPVDWCVGNPPFSEFATFLRHAFRVSENVLFLSALNKPWNSLSLLEDIYQWGGIRQVFVLGTGSDLGFPIGFAVAAIHYERNWKGPLTTSFYGHPLPPPSPEADPD